MSLGLQLSVQWPPVSWCGLGLPEGSQAGEMQPSPSSSVPLANYNQQADTGGSGDGASVCGRGFSFLRLMEKPYFPKQ